MVKCHKQDTRWGGVFILSREAVDVSHSPSQLGKASQLNFTLTLKKSSKNVTKNILKKNKKNLVVKEKHVSTYY